MIIWSILKLKAPDGEGVLVPGIVAEMPNMVQLEYHVVVEPVVLKVPIGQPGVMDQELICRLQHQVCLLLGEEISFSSWSQKVIMKSSYDDSMMTS